MIQTLSAECVFMTEEKKGGLCSLPALFVAFPENHQVEIKSVQLLMGDIIIVISVAGKGRLLSALVYGVLAPCPKSALQSG